MGQSDHDFYLLFLSKVPQGFLPFPRDRPQIYSDGEKQSTSADLLLKALVYLNVLFPCYFCFQKLGRCLSFLVPIRLKITTDVIKGPQFMSQVKKKKKSKKTSDNTPPPSSYLTVGMVCLGIVVEILLPLEKLLQSFGGWGAQEKIPLREGTT